MFKLIKNPFYIYILGFILTFFVYALDWSELYPPIDFNVKLFFTITFVIFIFLGVCIDKLKLVKLTQASTKHRLIANCFYIIGVLYLFEFLYEKDVPLLSKLIGRQGVSYREFGIPLLHGILISFNSFVIAHSFTVYMSTKKRRALIVYVLLYVPALLILNRSIIVFGLLTSLFIYIHFMGKVRLKNQVKLGLLSLVALFLFGVVGNLRSGGDYIYSQSRATEDFMESSVPKEYYWTYLYVASPLANFQNTINNKNIEEYDFKGFIFYENLPKIVSKNLGDFLDVERRDLIRIVPWLTVGTTYARSYSYIGWYGPYLLLLFNLLIYLTVIFLVPKKSGYHTTTIGILSVIILLNIFTNMLIVTGISFQLAYCVIFAFFERKRFVLRKA